MILPVKVKALIEEVAPVVDKGAESVEVYFPLGDQWIDLWSGSEVGKPGQGSRNRRWDSIRSPGCGDYSSIITASGFIT